MLATEDFMAHPRELAEREQLVEVVDFNVSVENKLFEGFHQFF